MGQRHRMAIAVKLLSGRPLQPSDAVRANARPDDPVDEAL